MESRVAKADGFPPAAVPPEQVGVITGYRSAKSLRIGDVSGCDGATVVEQLRHLPGERGRRRTWSRGGVGGPAVASDDKPRVRGARVLVSGAEAPRPARHRPGRP